MRSLSQLADDLERIGATLPAKRGNDLKKKCAETILYQLILNTPVDTGAAISNWLIGIDEPNRLEIPAYFAGKKGSTETVCQEAALAAGLAAIADAAPGQEIYISNNLPYIRVLDSGSSKQEPAGFVDRAQLLGRLFAENPQDFAEHD